jgi:hypothetical protein
VTVVGVPFRAQAAMMGIDPMEQQQGCWDARGWAVGRTGRGLTRLSTAAISEASEEPGEYRLAGSAA